MQESVDRQLTGRYAEAKGQQSGSSPTPNHLYSPSPQVFEAVTAIPPTQVAEFLFDVFFRYAHTNYVYADEQWLRIKLRDFYTTSSTVTVADSPWICTLLMVFAIGTQFAHLTSIPEVEGDMLLEHGEAASRDDKTALYFYHAACKLIPDVMATASIESVQAFLLLGVFTLPLDASGLSCTYLGIAISIATQNDLHRLCIRKPDTQKTLPMYWIWWTTCTLERRVCILHGRPVSISRDEANMELPQSLPEAQLTPGADTRPHTVAMIRFVDALEEARAMIVTFKTGPQSSKASAMRSLLNLKQNIQQYWHLHPHNNTRKPFEPSNPAFRSTHHLALTYHLVHIFIGRPFIFEAKESTNTMPLEQGPSASSEMRDTLVLECVRSSLAVINIVQTLCDRSGLARASYTESSTLCAALMVLLAKGMDEPNEEVEEAIAKGKSLLDKMLLGIYSGNQEKAAVEALDAAVSRLQRNAQKGQIDRSKTVNYAHFQNWIGNKDREVNRDAVALNGGSDVTSTANHDQSPALDVYVRPRFSQAEIDEMLVLPGLEDWFNFSYVD
ncbi:hypothetical protein SLS60_007176 [Paraconiothyrium brasiliense]|uniref:Xylanolytic transcriptional activator regulatory domain-containing protein n=1 Tax=Paraconiothyrium brasiliense TaxID=300254 RepID=A0ABR3R8M7_9PLEO